MTTEFLFSFLDLLGTFVFALSGAEAAKERELDLFGIIIIGFLTACGGGIIRDLCLGIHPPVGISYWPYLALTLVATFTIAVFLGQNFEVAILLGVLSAIGGGIIRDTLLGRVPVVLRKEVYGSAALLGSIIVVLFYYFKLDSTVGAWIGITVCFMVRYFSIKKNWNLPKI